MYLRTPAWNKLFIFSQAQSYQLACALLITLSNPEPSSMPTTSSRVVCHDHLPKFKCNVYKRVYKRCPTLAMDAVGLPVFFFDGPCTRTPLEIMARCTACGITTDSICSQGHSTALQHHSYSRWLTFLLARLSPRVSTPPKESTGSTTSRLLSLSPP